MPMTMMVHLVIFVDAQWPLVEIVLELTLGHIITSHHELTFCGKYPLFLERVANTAIKSMDDIYTYPQLVDAIISSG